MNKDIHILPYSKSELKTAKNLANNLKIRIKPRIPAFLNSNIEAQMNPIYRESSTKVFLDGLLDFFEQIPTQQRPQVWWSLIQSGEKRAQSNGIIANTQTSVDTGIISRIKKRKKDRREVAAQRKQLKSEMNESLVEFFIKKNRRIKRLIEKFFETPDSQKLLFSNRVLQKVGITGLVADFSEKKIDSTPKPFTRRELIASYLVAQDGFLPDFVFRGKSQNDLGSVLLNQESYGMVSELIVRDTVLEPLTQSVDPFNSMSDDMFYKVVLLCKVHRLLEGDTLIAQVLISLIRDRAKRLSGKLPKFIEVLPSADIKTKSPFLEILQQLATTTLASTLESRSNFTVAVDEKAVADRRMRLGGSVDGTDTIEEVALSKQKLALAGTQVHRWNQTYSRQLTAALTHCAQTVGYSAEPKHGRAALDNLTYFIRSKRGVIGQVKDFLNKAVLEVKQQGNTVTGSHTDFPIASKFIEMLKQNSPDFVTFLESNFSFDGEVETTALVCLLIQYVELSLEQRTDPNFIRTFNYFSGSELEKAERNSIKNLSAIQKLNLSQEIKNVDLSFSLNDQSSHLSSDSGVILLSSKELEELNLAITSLLSGFNYDTKSSKGNNLSHAFCLLLVLAPIIISVNQVRDGSVSQLFEKFGYEVSNGTIDNVIDGFFGASIYFFIRYLSNHLSQFFPLFLQKRLFLTKLNEFMSSIADIEKKMSKNLPKMLRNYLFIALLLASSIETYDKNKDALGEFLLDTYNGITNFASDWGLIDGEQKIDVFLGNNVDLERAGQPEYRIFPYNFSGYVMDRNILFMNSNGVLKKIRSGTSVFESNIPPSEEFPKRYVSFYGVDDTIFSLAEKENIPLEVNQGESPEYLLMSVDNDAFPNIAGYVPIKIFLSGKDYQNFTDEGDEHKIYWSPFESTEMSAISNDIFFVEYRKIGLFDADVQEYYVNQFEPPLTYFIFDSYGGYFEAEKHFRYFDKKLLMSTVTDSIAWSSIDQTLDKDYFEERGFHFNPAENQHLHYFQTITFDSNREYYPMFEIVFFYKRSMPNGSEIDDYFVLELPYNFQKNPSIRTEVEQKLLNIGFTGDVEKIKRFIDGLEHIKIVASSIDTRSYLVLIDDDGIGQLNNSFLSVNESLEVWIEGINLGDFIDISGEEKQSMLSTMSLGSVDNDIQISNVPFSSMIDFSPNKGDYFFVPDNREAEKNLVMNDPELRWILESDFAKRFYELRYNAETQDYLELLKNIQAELKLRGLNYEDGDQFFAGNLENIRDMLRVDPETGQLKNPNQVCNGMSAMVYYVARLWQIDVAMLQLNVKSEYTSYAGNQSSDHMVVIYRPASARNDENKSWQIFEATLPDTDQSVSIPQLSAETAEMLEAEMSARNAGAHVLDLTTLFATGLGSAGLGIGLYYVQKKVFQKETAEGKDANQVIPNKKLTRIFKKMNDAETVFLAHVLQHSRRDGTMRVFWETNIQPDEATEKYSQKDLKRVVDVALADMVRFTIEDAIDQEGVADTAGLLAEVNRSSVIEHDVRELLSTSDSLSDSLGYKKYLGMIFKGEIDETNLSHYLGYRALLKSFARSVKSITRQQVLATVKKELLESDRKKIIRHKARKQMAGGDKRDFETVVLSLTQKKMEKIEYELADLVEKRINRVGQTLKTLSRI